jgi:hypothetical protein
MASPTREKNASDGAYGTDEAELARMGYKQELRYVNFAFLDC